MNRQRYPEGLRVGDLELRFNEAVDRWEIVRWTDSGSCYVVAHIRDRTERGEASDLHTVGLRPWEYDGPVAFWPFARRCVEFLTERRQYAAEASA